jgi:hypothetical protein
VPDLGWAYEASAQRDEIQRQEWEAAELSGVTMQTEAETWEIESQNEATTSADEPARAVTLIVTETGAEENGRNEIQGSELASAEDDELLSEDELETSAEEIWASVGVREERSFSFGKGEHAGTRETFDETLVLVRGVLPSIARVLAEERK